VGSAASFSASASGLGVSVPAGLEIAERSEFVPVSEMSVTTTPPGALPWVTAVFSNPPASMSACVSVYVAVKASVDSPAAREATGPPATLTFGSVTTTSVNPTLPTFVTTNR